MGGRKSRLHQGLLQTAAVGLAAVALAGCSRGGEAQEAVEILPGRIEPATAAEVIVAEGGHILRDVAEARAEIHRGYLFQAERDIDRADRNLDVIEESMPTAEVKERIWVARRHLEYGEISEVTSDLVRIYAAVEQAESIAPADSIRRQLERTKHHLERGDRKAAGRALARADQELLFVEVDLPLSSTRRHLAEARGALAMGEPDRAAVCLQRAENDLALLTSFARSPLESGRWSLASALAALTKGDIEATEQYVTLARWSLERAGDEAPEASRTALREVVDELRDLEGRLAADPADVLDTLGQLVDRVRALARPG